MKVTLTLDDTLYAKLKKQAKIHTDEGTREEIKARLQRFADIPSKDRTIVLAGDDRRELEAIFGVSFDNPKDLIRRAHLMSTATIEGVEMHFTDDELFRIKTQASFFGKTAKEYLEEQVLEISGRMLERV